MSDARELDRSEWQEIRCSMDTTAILQLVARYVSLVDAKQWGELPKRCLTEEIYLDYTRRTPTLGREEIRTLLQQAWDRLRPLP